MKLDSITLHSVVHEIKETVIPSKIIDFYQLSKYEMLLVLKKNQSLKKLFFCIQPGKMAFFLSDRPLPSQNFSSLFFNQLQNWVQGGTLLKIEHPQFDRIIKLVIQSYHKFGPTKQYQLVIEFMDKHSNVILIDEQDKIKGALKQVGSQINRYREIKPGLSYIPPPKQDKTNPLTIDKKEFFQLLVKNRDLKTNEYLWQFFQTYFNGIGTKNAREIVALMNFPLQQRLNQISEEAWPELWDQFSLFIQKIVNHHLTPIVLTSEKSGKAIDYSLLYPVEQKDMGQIPFKQVSPCLEYLYYRLKEDDQKKDLYHLINKVLKKNIEKLTDKKDLLQRKQEEIEKSEEYKKKGELIKANLWNINPGMEKAALVDYLDEGQTQIVITLKPCLTPLQNAKEYFKKYKKLQQNRNLIQQQIKENQKSLSCLRQMKIKIVEPYSKNSLEDLSLLYNKLIKLNYIKKEKSSSARRTTEQTPAISKFLSPDGWTILVGKNSKQNEYILRHLTSGKDFWLHNLTRPGGHVIIKNHKNLESPPHHILNFAARLAGYYSKTKDKESAIIVYTMRKHVRKPKNAKMGKVIYTNEKTISLIVNHAEIRKDIHQMIVT